MSRGLVKASLIIVVLALAGGGTWYYVNQKQAGTKPAVEGAKAAQGGAPGTGGVKGAGKGAGKGTRPVPVVVATVEQRDVPVTLSAVGRAEAFSTVSVRSRIDAQVLSVDFSPGQHVRKGQTLFRLDPAPVEAQLRQAQGNLLRDQAQLGKARADLDRYTDLAKRGFVSPSAVDGYKASVEALEGTVKLGQAAVDFQKIQLGFTNVTAPMDGIAGAVLVHAGANVKANDTAMVVINQMQPIYVTFAIPEGQLDGVRALQKRGAVNVSVHTRDGSRDTLPARLAFIDNAIDTSTGTITLKAAYPNGNQRLTPGQFVDVSLVTRVIDKAIVMPVEAMQMSPNGNIVFVVTEDNKVEVRPVRSSVTAGGFLLVNDGFAPGDRVVIDGQLRLFPGASIEVRTPGGSGKGGAGKGAAKGEAGKSVERAKS